MKDRPAIEAEVAAILSAPYDAYHKGTQLQQKIIEVLLDIRDCLAHPCIEIDEAFLGED